MNECITTELAWLSDAKIQVCSIGLFIPKMEHVYGKNGCELFDKNK